MALRTVGSSVLLLLATAPAHTAAQDNVGDAAALRLMIGEQNGCRDGGGPNSCNNFYWGGWDTPMCDEGSWDNTYNRDDDWHGVMCDEIGGRAVAVTFGFGELTGHVDIAGLAPISELRYFSCYGNARTPDVGLFGDIASLAVLRELRFIDVRNTAVHGDIASLAVLTELGGSWVRPAGWSSAGATDPIYNFGSLFLSGSHVHGDARVLQALPNLGSSWSPAAGRDYTFTGTFTQCSAFTRCEALGLRRNINAVNIAGNDECACCGDAPSDKDGYEWTLQGRSWVRDAGSACLAPPPPPPPPPLPPLAPPPQAAGGESDCDSVGEFTLYADEVNKACCGGVASPSCVGGQPTECTGGCEAVLMPMARVCANFLERMGLNTTVAYATNLCHPQQVAGQSGH
jgi:hypothetical protein